MKSLLLKAFLPILPAMYLLGCGKDVSVPGQAVTSASTLNSAFLLTPNSDGWIRYTSPSAMNNSYFGRDAAIGDFNGDGYNDVAVGAPYNDGANTDSGGVAIYYGSSNLSGMNTDSYFDQMILAPNTNGNAFGYSVLSADVNNDNYLDLIVGAILEDPSDRGAVYIYYGSTNGLSSTPDQTIVHPTATANSGFGSALAFGDLNGDGYSELIVGSMYDDTTNTNAGCFWIFEGIPSNIFSIAFATKVRFAAGSATDYLGASLALADINGDTHLDILAGVPLEDTAGADSGSIRVYYGTNSSATWVTSLTVSDLEISNPLSLATTYYGWAMATADITGDGATDLVVGMPLSDYFNTDAGMTLVYSDIEDDQYYDGIVPAPESPLTTLYAGYGIAIGDVNSDGQNDVLIGIPLYSGDKGYREGRLEVHYGNNSGEVFFDLPDLIFQSWGDDQNGVYYGSNDIYGWSTCTGDLNGDGITDMVVGAPTSDSIYSDNGSVSIYFSRGNEEYYNVPSKSLRPGGYDYTAKRYGTACVIMDFNLDGYNDLLIGADGDDIGGADGGAVFIHLGNGETVTDIADHIIIDPGDTANGFGKSIAYGDLNNDGFNDLAIGAYLDDTGGADRGRVYVYQSDNVTGQINLSTSTAFQTVTSNTEYFGYSIAIIDMDGDGDDELLVGSPYNDTSATDSGRVVVYDNPGTVNTLLNSVADSYIYHPTLAANSAFGSAIAQGPYLQNTYNDLLIGAMADDGVFTDGGAIYVYPGSATGPDSSYSIVEQGIDGTASTSDNFGASIGLIDLNQDGTMDLAVGAIYDETPGQNNGSVFVKIQ